MMICFQVIVVLESTKLEPRNQFHIYDLVNTSIKSCNGTWQQRGPLAQSLAETPIFRNTLQFPDYRKQHQRD